MAITKRVAIRDSLIVWKYKMETGDNNTKSNDYLRFNYPKIYDEYLHFCGLCQKYKGSIKGHYCEGCPIEVVGKRCINKEGSCLSTKGYYGKWLKAKTKKTRIKYATLMYNLIKSFQK